MTLAELDPSPAVRARRYRDRRRAGRISLRIDVLETAVIEALIASGRLTEGEALRRASIERELAQVVADWAQRWAK
jgi:hypothetical protein